MTTTTYALTVTNPSGLTADDIESAVTFTYDGTDAVAAEMPTVDTDAVQATVLRTMLAAASAMIRDGYTDTDRDAREVLAEVISRASGAGTTSEHGAILHALNTLDY